MSLTDHEIERYGRQILLPEVGGAGQERLRAASVLVLGLGGLGSPAALYLAAAGVGRIGLMDADGVDATNLHRQVLHHTPDIGRSKAASAAEKLARLNPLVRLEPREERFEARSALEIVRGYDAVVDGTDNFPTRFLANDACVVAQKPLVHAAVLRWQGQILTILPGRSACYRCLFREPPPPGSVASCSEAGILGPVAGILGCLQAAEAIKLLLGRDELLAGRLLTCDLLAMRFHAVELRRDPACPACGSGGPIRELRDEAGNVCAVPAAAR